MNTPSTKTRALCVATRCTTVEQFVATFHRFCGDDETFFVATMTSRPIGLETPFSIQLADKQPVLRGLCIVLDAWDTPENQYKRPGIRLGIKRLTADSQVIYDRLKAASRSPASAVEATPPPGSAPPPKLAAGSQPPGTMRRGGTPPPLPPLLPPRPTPPAVPAIPRDGAPLAVVHVPPLGAATPTTAPRLPREPSNGSPPRGVAARPALPSVVPVETKPGASTPRTAGDTKPRLPGAVKPVLPSVPPVTADGRRTPPRGMPGGKPALPTVAPVEAKPGLPAGGKPTLPGVMPGEVRPALPILADVKPAPASGRPTLPGVMSVEVKPALPAATEVKPGSPGTADAKPALPGAAEVKPSPPGAPENKPASPSAPPSTAPTAGTAAVATAAPAAPAPAGRAAPIAVTRFQVALRVDASPPPLTSVEFKPTELAPRKRFDRIIGEPSPSEAQSDDALPAVILDRPSEPVSAAPGDPAPSFVPYDNTNPTADPLAARRTPGSSLVLPANPLQDLTDESIEGFVDCTMYEETENIFHPGVDGPEWADVTAETPMQQALLAAARRSSPWVAVPAVPAMPYDTPPNLTVRAQGGTESLAVAPEDPALSRAVVGELGSASPAAADPGPMRPSSGPLGVPSAEIIDDPPSSPPAAVIVDDPLLSRAVSGELGSRPEAADDPLQSRTMAGELWSETWRRTQADGQPRTQPRPETPLPRPASNVPMDLGDSPDPASWFDSVSLPHGGAAPRPAMAMEAALAPAMDADPPLAPGMAAEHGFAPAVAVDPSLLAAMPPGSELVSGMPPGPEFAPGMPPAGFTPGMPPGPGLAPGMPPGAEFAPGVPPGPGLAPGMPPGAEFAPGMPPAGFTPGMLPGPEFAPGMPPAGFTQGMPPGPEFAPGMPPGPGLAPGMPPGFGFGPPMPTGPGPDPVFVPAPLDPSMPVVMPPAMAPGYGPLESGPVGPPGYQVDSAPYPRYSAADLMGPPAMPVARAQPPWQRWLLIGGSVVIAIILAFVVARLARGHNRAAPAAGAGDPASAPARAVAPSRASPAPAGSAASPAGDPDGAAGDTEPPATDEDVAVAVGGPLVVGSGPCRFTVATTPARAAVRFDDQPMGPSPITIQGSCDKHKVDVAHARYQSVSKWVTLTADKPQELDISLLRPIHAVTVTSSPPGAELSIDGHRAGTTPTTVQMAGFATVSLTFTKPGFQTVTRKVYSKLPQDHVSVKLTK